MDTQQHFGTSTDLRRGLARESQFLQTNFECVLKCTDATFRYLYDGFYTELRNRSPDAAQAL